MNDMFNPYIPMMDKDMGATAYSMNSMPFMSMGGIGMGMGDMTSYLPGGMGMPYMGTSYLGGTTMYTGPNRDTYGAYQAKEQKHKKNVKNILVGLGVTIASLALFKKVKGLKIFKPRSTPPPPTP